MAKPLNVGLVGGGKGAFIVHPHQKAIHFDGTRRVVAGALYRNNRGAYSARYLRHTVKLWTPSVGWKMCRT